MKVIVDIAIRMSENVANLRLLGPDRVELRKWPNPVRKVKLEIEEDLGRKVTSSKLGASKDFTK